MSSLGKSLALVFVALFLTSLVTVLSLSTPAEAQSKTIVVPDDYTTIQSAIDHASARDTVFFKNGTYEGPINQTIVINKNISIIGENVNSTIIKLYPAYNMTWLFATAFTTYSDAIAITADNFKIQNLTVIVENQGGFITAKGNGIEITSNNIRTGVSTGVNVNGTSCKISNNTVDGHIQLAGSYSEIAENYVSSIFIYGSHNTIKRNICESSISLGYESNNANNNLILGNSIINNNYGNSGIFLSYSNDNFFCKNKLSGIFGYGIELWNSNNNTITANDVTNSQLATITEGNSSNNKIYLNNFIKNNNWRDYIYDEYTDPNIRAAYPTLTISTNIWDFDKKGNHWGNYNGSDLNNDGIGDTPYVINVNNQDNFPLMVPTDIDSINVTLPEWTFASLPTPSPSINPLPEPKPELFSNATIVVISMVALVVCISIALVLHRRHRKPTLLSK
jgi:parallel beta-helix repeat protein